MGKRLEVVASQQVFGRMRQTCSDAVDKGVRTNTFKTARREKFFSLESTLKISNALLRVTA
jgi:hypothetical protein